jgi:hypothetical protein
MGLHGRGFGMVLIFLLMAGEIYNTWYDDNELTD